MPVPAPQAREPLALSELPPGATVVVAGVEGADPVATRLRDLGFLEGTPVRVVRRAPLGDPTLYELRGYRLSLRRSEARRIAVRPDAAPEPPR
jgi:ferrous iron transport protein A